MALLSVFAGVGACGAGLPLQATDARASGQSGLMTDTFAGQNKCNPKNQDRPFVVEWDATDMSSFESQAGSDIIVVHYEGCELKVLEQCKDDDVRGVLGAYKPVDWTSGQLETVDIANEAELYTKLPLGAASLGGRVHSGEKFHMEYYVSGTRKATRENVFRADLAKTPGCKGATHFVYGYNLGAFALGSAKNLNAKADASVYGFGAGGSSKSRRQVDKKGGDLAACHSESAKEIEGCKVPIRLILRDVRDGEDPNKTAEAALDSDASLNAAGRVSKKLEMSSEAAAHFESATQKMNSGDGAGCLTEFDEHDKLNPNHKSTDPKSALAALRGRCLMIAGQCDAGKQLARKGFENSLGTNSTPEQIDQVADGLAAQFCQGTSMKPRDALLKALHDLSQGATVKKDAELCKRSYEAIVKLRHVVKPRDDEDNQVIYGLQWVPMNVPKCFARAGDCDLAYKLLVKEDPEHDRFEKLPAEQRDKLYKDRFATTAPQCVKKN